MAANLLACILNSFVLTYARLGADDIARIDIRFFENKGVLKLSWIDDTSSG